MEASAPTLGLRELEGPSALSSGGWKRFWRVLWRVTKSDFRLRYSQPLLGYIWPLLGPMLFAVVLYFAFTRFLRFGGGIENYPFLLIFNVLMFQFFIGGSSTAVRSFVAKQNLTRKVEFPVLAVPLASVASNFVSYCLNMLVAFGLFLAVGIEVRWTWLLFPVITLGWVMVTSVSAVLLASVFVRIRDLGEIWSATSRALFYTSPVIIPIEFYPEKWHWILQFNPLAPILAEARVWIVDPNAPTFADVVGGGASSYLLPLGVFVAGAVAAVFAFRWAAPRAAER